MNECLIDWLYVEISPTIDPADLLDIELVRATDVHESRKHSGLRDSYDRIDELTLHD